MFVLHEQTVKERLILEGRFLETGCEEPLGAHAGKCCCVAQQNYGIACWSVLGKAEGGKPTPN